MMAELRRDFGQWIDPRVPALDAGLGRPPPLSVDLVREFLVPRLGREPGLLRGPRLHAPRPVARDRRRSWPSTSRSRRRYHYSILPTATPYARNAIFSGQFPDEIAATAAGVVGCLRRRGEPQRVRGRAARRAARAADGTRRAGPLREDLLGPRRAIRCAARVNSAPRRRRARSIALVFNFVDLMTHGRSESPILMEVARDEAALRDLTRSWFERSTAFQVLREAARAGTPGGPHHGPRLDPLPAARRRSSRGKDATSNLRYKFGQDLRAEVPVDRVRHARRDGPAASRRVDSATTYLMALEDYFFVYPTKLREYQARYRNSFLHGGISPEEMIVPVASLTPRRRPTAVKPSAARHPVVPQAAWAASLAAAVVATALFAVLDAAGLRPAHPLRRGALREPGAAAWTERHGDGPSPRRDRLPLGRSDGRPARRGEPDHRPHPRGLRR